MFFIGFGEGFGARTSGGASSQVLSMVLMFGVLGTGFFGAGMRATIERETGILRRFKVAPITPGPILAAGIVTGLLLFLPAVFLFLALGHFRYGMPWPANLFSLLVIVSAGVVAFRSLGMIIAATVNSMAESQIIIQLLYLPMLMLSGATVPLSVMPEWLQTVAQFLPSTHLYLGMQGVLVRGETLAQNLESLGGLMLATVVGLSALDEAVSLGKGRDAEAEREAVGAGRAGAVSADRRLADAQPHEPGQDQATHAADAPQPDVAGAERADFHGHGQSD